MHGRIALLASIGALAGLGLHAASAGAVTFGADLSVPSTDPNTCDSIFGPSATSCMFHTGGAQGGPSFYTPASGTVTTVRVRAGSVGGPMQVLVLRSLYQNSGEPGRPNFYCCFVEQYGPVFNAAANTVTPVATSLNMVADPTPAADDRTSIARGDFLALSVLAPGVPIPAAQDGVSFGSGYVPAPNPQTNPAPSPGPLTASISSRGAHLAMNADLDTGGGCGGGGRAGGRGSRR